MDFIINFLKAFAFIMVMAAVPLLFGAVAGSLVHAASGYMFPSMLAFGVATMATLAGLVHALTEAGRI